jgi:hypothetical protein
MTRLLSRDAIACSAAAVVLSAMSCAKPMAASTTQQADAQSVSTDAGVCPTPAVVALGQSLTGTTCGGMQRPFGESVCEVQSHPVAYVRVDAPAGTPIRIDSTSKLTLLGFDDCANPPKECTAFGTSLAPRDPSLRLFAIEHDDVACGTFSISVAPQ